MIGATSSRRHAALRTGSSMQVNAAQHQSKGHELLQPPAVCRTTST